MKYFNYLKYNSYVILTYFFLSLIVLILKNITNRKTNKLFTSGRDSILNPLTYIRMFTHILGHTNYNHFKNNFLYILLIGPMIEEKYGSINLLIMILITSFITALINTVKVQSYRCASSSASLTGMRKQVKCKKPSC